VVAVLPGGSRVEERPHFFCFFFLIILSKKPADFCIYKSLIFNRVLMTLQLRPNGVAVKAEWGAN